MFYIISPVCSDRAFIFTPNPSDITAQYTFNKTEKLKSRKLIEHLFSKGKSMSAFPLKVLYDFIDEPAEPLKTGVTVSSRSFKKAVDRNRIKRVLREAYRLQKLPLKQLLETRQQSVVLFFIYTGKELPVYKEVHKKMGTLLQRLIESILISNQ